MALLTRNDLQFFYNWTATGDDNPALRGEPDSSLFNRHDGYDVLYIINHLADKKCWNHKSSGLKAERLIRGHLPFYLRSQELVIKWLNDNWDNY
jgi:hypothetical protein